jgi:ATP-binding cassette, subfamily B (MDR/TAP), member 1
MAGLRISAGLRLSYMKALLSQPISKLDEITAGSVSNTITSSANTIQLSICDRLSLMFQALALLISAYIIALRYSWALTLVASSALLFIILVYSFSTPIAIKAMQKVEKADEKHASIAGEIFSSIRTVFSLGAEKPLSERYFHWVDESRRRGLKIAPLYGSQLAPAWFAMNCSFALCFWFGLKLYREGHIANVGTVITVFFSVLIVVAVMGNIVQPIMNITKAISTSVQFFKLIDSDKLSYAGRRAPEVSAQADIEFRDVTFSYPTRSGVQVLKHFNAKFQRGKTTALVGPSGSGKSTIVALLERWYQLTPRPSQATASPRKDPAKGESKEQELGQHTNEGSIVVGGENINSLDLKWWRTQIGLVQQEPFLFNDTVFNNVKFGLLGTDMMQSPEEKIRELVEEACVEAFADEFIQRLPKKYDTMVGESGIKLSGGQRQRVAIARSIVRRPVILILDEATSSIDVHAEAIVQKSLERVSKDRTTIIIAHRLSTIRKADHIVVLRGGTKLEEGTHEELLLIDDGLYSGLVHAQQLEEQSALQDSEIEKADNTALTSTVSSKGTGNEAETAEDDTPKWKKRGFFRSVGLFLYEQRQHWPFYALTVLAAACCGTAFALQSWYFAKLVEAFQFTGQKLVKAGNFWALMFFILGIATAIAYFTLGSASTFFSTHIAAAYRREYFLSILGKPISFYDQEDNASGSLMSKLSTDPKQLQQLLGLEGAFSLISIFNLAGSISISFAFGWKLTLVVLFSAMPVILVASFFRMQWEVKFEDENAKVFAGSSRFATEAIGAFRTVSSLTMEDTIVKKYDELLHDQIRSQARTASYATLIFAFVDSADLACMALAFWYGGQLLASREYNPVQFFVIYIAIVQGGQAAGQFFSFAPNLAQTKGAANRIIQYREPTSKTTDAKPKAVPSTSSDGTVLGAKVEFNKVTFKYTSLDSPTFANLSISIPPGTFAALVGASGCGKTSCISLLERFYEPISGTITMNDTDISTLDLTSYRKELSLVAQEPRLFEGSIKENLLLGVDKDSVTEEQMRQAYKDAEIHDFIISLPEGYGTELGINTQTALSGGQKQRLCLARALLRRPKLLLLDEATSSLDSQSEKLVQAAIERLAGQRSMTVIAVAHRLATIQKADIIFVFGEGEEGKGSRILEKGTHSELLGRRGTYWGMCRGQALDR